MKTIGLILKGILLYATILSYVIFVCGIDYIYDNGYFLSAIIIIATLTYICYNIISEEEADILIGNKFLEKHKK